MTAQFSGAITIKLASVLDMDAVMPLATALMEHRGTPVTLDASDVHRIGGQCLQVLLSAELLWKSDRQTLRIAAPSDDFRAGCEILGVPSLGASELFGEMAA